MTDNVTYDQLAEYFDILKPSATVFDRLIDSS